jgi:hypothetical protein
MKNMFLPSIALFSALTDTATGGGTPAEAPVAAKKKQHTVTLRESDKGFLNDLQKEFYGPQASDPDAKRYLSTEEAFQVILEVATDYRTGHRQAVEIVEVEGVETECLSFNEDGSPKIESFDRFAEVAARVIAARGVVRTSSKVQSLQAKIAALTAQLAAQAKTAGVEFTPAETAPEA